MRRTVFIVNDISVLGGSTRVTANLANKMAEQDDVKIISLFKSNKSSIFQLQDNIEVITLYSKQVHIYELTTYIKFLKEFKLGPILNLFCTLIYLLLGYPFKKNALKKHLMSVDNIIVPEIYGLFFITNKIFSLKNVFLQIHSTFDYIVGNRIINIVLKIYRTKIKSLIVLTDSDKEKFKKIGFENVVRIYNPICSNYQVIERKISKKIVYVGRLDIVKGIDYLLEIFKLLIMECDASLEIYGDGSMKKDIELFIERNQYENKINIHGYIENVYEAITGANCLISPSRNEGLPMVFLEAFQCQVPVVAFKSFPGIFEIISDGDNGFILEIGDVKGAFQALKLLLEDTDLNRKLGENSLKTIKKFNINQIINEWYNVFDVNK